MFHRILKLSAAALVAGGSALTLHAQMAQDPLLSRTAAVQPSIVFMFDDSGSMNSTALYQFGGGAGYQGQRGPNNDTECNSGSGCIWISPPVSYYGRSPDVNLIYYDPRVTYAKRINADGTSQAAGSTASVSSFDVYFYKPPSFNTYSVSGVTISNKGTSYPSTGILASFPTPPAGGTQATATVQTTSTTNVSSVTMNTSGSGYSNLTTASFTAPPAGGTQATGTVQTGTSSAVSSVAVTTRGVDYAAGTTATFNAPGGTGTQATGNVVLSATNKVGSVNMTSIGSGYPAAGVTATFAAPPAPGVTATGTPVIASTQNVSSVAVNTRGSGYPTAGVTATFSPPAAGGVTATGSPVVTSVNQVSSVTLTAPGADYPSSGVTATFSTPPAPGVQALATVSVGATNKVGSVTVNNGGGGYPAGVTATFSAPPAALGAITAAGTVALATSNTVQSVAVTTQGQDYPTSGVTATFSAPGGGGTTAAGTVTVSPTSKVGSVTVNAGGGGYPNSGVTATFSAPAAPGVAATGNVTLAPQNGVQSVTVSNKGHGYPAGGVTATFSSPGAGTTATGTVVMGSTFTANSVTVNNSGSGYTAPTATFNAAPGGGVTATATLSTATTYRITGINVVSGGSYNAGLVVTLSSPTLPGGVQATATATRAAGGGARAITAFTVTNQGSGYTTPPTIVSISNAVTAGTFTPVTSAYGGVAITAINVTNPGYGYTVAPVLTVTGGGVGGAFTVNTGTDNNIASINITNPGTGYGSAPTITLGGTGAGTGAAFVVTMTAGYMITGINITSPGIGYAGPPSITLGGVGAGTGAAFTPNMIGSGWVTGFTVTSPGSGYTSTPSITLAGTGSGSGATFTPTMNLANKITAINITNPGMGYSSPPTITLGGTGGGGGAAFTVNMTPSNWITGIAVTNPGMGYTGTPTLTLGGVGSGTGAAYTVNTASTGWVSGFTLSNGGSGYVGPPTITLGNTGGGSGASFNLTMGTTNSIAGIAITNPGSGYTSAPAITLGAVGGGSGATPVAVLAPTNWITGFTVTNAGSGYGSTPTITLGSTGSGTGATFTVTPVTVRGITGITVTNPGAGYTSTPTITLANTGGGVGAAWTVNTGTTNVISGITVTNAGSGYTTQPALTLTNTAPGSGVAYTVNYNTIPVQPANKVWDGTGTPTTSAGYFTPSYTPDSGSPMAAGATVLAYPNTASSSTANYPKFKNRTDCSATACTWAQEQQNYANWKTYHSTRIDLAKTGIGLAFQPLNPTFRLGWGTINGLNGSSTLDKGVRTFSGVTVTDFFTWLYSRVSLSSNSTPNRIALDRVGQYFQRKDTNGPWADSPNGNGAISAAGTDSTHATCRRAYSMLMTDGYYNDSLTTLGDVDTTAGPTISSPTSYQYIPIGPYSDTTNGTKVQNTFADVAMKYWVTDLRPDIANAVKAVSGDEAYWQHMSFYAIGLGLIGTLDATNPAVLQSLTGNSSTTPPRSLNWPTAAANDPRAIDDMWHATINGRGKMLNAKTASELNAAIAQMMSDISGKEGVQAGVAVSSPSLTKDTKKYTPTYTPITWNGNVTAYNLDATTGEQIGIAWQVETLVSTDPTTGKKTFSSIIPDASTRNIFVGNGATSGTRAVPFTFSSLTSASLVAQMTGTVNQNMIDYLRGSPVDEDTSAAAASATAIYRERLTRLGDIVNSAPTFVKDSVDLSYEKLPTGTPGQSTYRAFVATKKARGEGVLFVGANDGMLHAFRDGTFDPTTGAVADPGGIEVFAYVPYSLLPIMSNLSDKAYVHRYYVDGPTTETDAYLASAGRWANIVTASTGGGAGALSSNGVSPKASVFAIDATSINSSVSTMGAANVLWEVSSSQAAFAELGYMLTDVQVGMTVGGTWVAIFGNGYESKSCQARLFVVNIETGALVREINTASGSCGSAATKNGLGGARMVLNSQKQIIGVYAGDLLGNLWKFNLNNASPASWGLDLAGQPLYTTGSSKPITAAPTIFTLPLVGTTDPATGFMVVFGTGKFYEVADITTTATQTVYGVWDPVAFGAGTIPAGTALTTNTLLVSQTIGSAQTGADGNTYFNISNNTVDYKGDAVGPPIVLPRRGWYFDLPNTGQRNVYPIDSVLDRFVIVDTISPSNVSIDPCVNQTGGTGYVYIVDALNGGGPTKPILDTNGDHLVDSNDLVVSGYQSGADGRNKTVNTTSDKDFVILSSDVGGKQVEFSCEMIDPAKCLPPPGVGNFKSRQWRQLFLR